MTYRVMAHTRGGALGAQDRICKSNGQELRGLSEDEASALAERYNSRSSPYGPAIIWYTVEAE